MGDELPIFSPNFGKPEEKPKQEERASFLDGVQVAPTYAADVKRVMGEMLAAHDAYITDAATGLPCLRAWRVARGWSQFEAAKQTGLSLSTWIRWETKGVPELKKAKLKEILR